MDVFAALRSGIKFDGRFKNDIKAFEKPVKPRRATAAPDPGELDFFGDKAGAAHGREEPRSPREPLDDHDDAETDEEPADRADASDDDGESDSGESAGDSDDDAPEDVPLFAPGQLGGGTALRTALQRVNSRSRDPQEAANIVRKAMRIKVRGDDPPAPLQSFAALVDEFACPPCVVDNVVTELRLGDPTPIQSQAWPTLLNDIELLAVAPTGSGKTLAFVLPLIAQVVKKMAAGTLPRRGVKAVVISPTRELAGQIAEQARIASKGSGVRCALLTKGMLVSGADLTKVDFLVATPLRLVGLVKDGKIDLGATAYVVLDEADLLLQMGFVEQADAILAAAGASLPKGVPCVRALFSATLPDTVEDLARSILHAPLRVTAGERNTAAATVRQHFVFAGREAGKLIAMRRLVKEGLKPPVLVFVESQERAKRLHRELMYDGIHVDSIHAGQSQAMRNAAVLNFRRGRTWVLICTDVLGRGMDFLGVNTVINYDFPATTADYIHRVGRTGRAGREGLAITLYTEDDKPRLRPIANLVKQAGGDVPEWMTKLKKERLGKRERALRREGKPVRPHAGGASGKSERGAPAQKKAAGAATAPPRRVKGTGVAKEQQGRKRGGEAAGEAKVAKKRKSK
ncbi:unnamed protein product [Pedinophyceae sp. YPF-701]|nr:unnamed protein product [Pedinophyceae sp. YPF-701]